MRSWVFSSADFIMFHYNFCLQCRPLPRTFLWIKGLKWMNVQVWRTLCTNSHTFVKTLQKELNSIINLILTSNYIHSACTTFFFQSGFPPNLKGIYQSKQQKDVLPSQRNCKGRTEEHLDKRGIEHQPDLMATLHSFPFIENIMYLSLLKYNNLLRKYPKIWV